jgi:hypothetical protein
MRYFGAHRNLIFVQDIEGAHMTSMPPRHFDPLRFCVAPRVSADERRQWIATAAYFKAEHRGFAPGNAAADWLEAESEIETLIAHGFVG